VLGNVLSLQRYAGRLGRYIDAVHAGELASLPELRQELRIDRIMADMPHRSTA
jgi:two-component system sensor histidine kinase HupT/HoxJ